jgi:peptidylprolyl isomerase
MTTAKQGDTVRIHYTGTLDDGRTFDSSEGSEPLEFTLGTRQVIAGFESAVLGMAVGEEKTVKIEPADAYGQRDENLVQTVARGRFPADAQIEIGTQFQASTQNGPLVVTVVEVDDDAVTVDANHMLAGQRLTFALRLVEVV